jgi:hypothetical protein
LGYKYSFDTSPKNWTREMLVFCGFAKWFLGQQEDGPEELHAGAACDGVVTGIQIRARADDIAAYRIIKNPNKTAMAATCFGL